jgi:signal peptidase complex subunit 3
MNTILARANTIFAFTLTVLAVLTFGCFLTTAFNERRSSVSISTTTPFVKNVPDYSAARELNDLGVVSFDLSADLTPLFNWNVKQLFVYLTAEYTTSQNKLNQVVIWDKIIRRGENAVLDFKEMKSKYYFFDDGHGLRANKNVTLVLAWNVIPNAGTLPRIQGLGNYRLQFPDDYSSVRL